MICDAATWTGFQTGTAVGFLLGAVFVLLLVSIHNTGRKDK